MAFSMHNICTRGVGVQNPKLLMFQGVCQPGNRQKWKVEWISIQIGSWKQKCRGGATKLKFWGLMWWTISILHQFQIDISSNSQEIKYQNIGRTHRYTDTHTHRQTDRVKTIPRNPLRGRGNYVIMQTVSNKKIWYKMLFWNMNHILWFYFHVLYFWACGAHKLCKIKLPQIFL